MVSMAPDDHVAALTADAKPLLSSSAETTRLSTRTIQLIFESGFDRAAVS